MDVLGLLGGGSHAGSIKRGLYHVVNAKFRVSPFSSLSEFGAGPQQAQQLARYVAQFSEDPQ